MAALTAVGCQVDVEAWTRPDAIVEPRSDLVSLYDEGLLSIVIVSKRHAVGGVVRFIRDATSHRENRVAPTDRGWAIKLQDSKLVERVGPVLFREVTWDLGEGVLDGDAFDAMIDETGLEMQREQPTVDLDTLSMGTSGDFRVARRKGHSPVRMSRAIFGHLAQQRSA